MELTPNFDNTKKNDINAQLKQCKKFYDTAYVALHNDKATLSTYKAALEAIQKEAMAWNGVLLQASVHGWKMRTNDTLVESFRLQGHSESEAVRLATEQTQRFRDEQHHRDIMRVTAHKSGPSYRGGKGRFRGGPKKKQA